MTTTSSNHADRIRAAVDEICAYFGDTALSDGYVNANGVTAIITRHITESDLYRAGAAPQGVVDTTVAADALLQESKLAYRAGQQSISALMAAEDEAIAKSQALAHAAFRAGVAACVEKVKELRDRSVSPLVRAALVFMVDDLESITDSAAAPKDAEDRARRATANIRPYLASWNIDNQHVEDAVVKIIVDEFRFG